MTILSIICQIFCPEPISVADPDPRLKRPLGSGSAWRDADPEVKKPSKCTGSLGEFKTGRSKVRILL